MKHHLTVNTPLSHSGTASVRHLKYCFLKPEGGHSRESNSEPYALNHSSSTIRPQAKNIKLCDKEKEKNKIEIAQTIKEYPAQIRNKIDYKNKSIIKQKINCSL